MKNRILPVFISFAGCTSRCVYCNQHRITGVKPSDTIKSARQQIESHLSMGVDWTELAFYGGSFTCLPEKIRLELYGLAKETGISTLRFSTSPDCISENVLKEALDNGVETVELGVQSLDDEVLKANKRPSCAKETEEAFRLIRKMIPVSGLQLMTGLYKEDFASFAETVDKAVKMNADYARIYPCVVLRDTELGDLLASGEYTPLTVSEAAARCAYAYIKLTAAGCSVIRMGLHEGAGVKDSVLGGAYHPAMGELVKTVVIATFYNLGFSLCCDQKYLSIVYGYGGSLKKMHKSQVVLKEGVRPDFADIAKRIMEELGENCQRKLQEQTSCHAERLFGQTHN